MHKKVAIRKEAPSAESSFLEIISDAFLQEKESFFQDVVRHLVLEQLLHQVLATQLPAEDHHETVHILSTPLAHILEKAYEQGALSKVLPGNGSIGKAARSIWAGDWSFSKLTSAIMSGNWSFRGVTNDAKNILVDTGMHIGLDAMFEPTLKYVYKKVGLQGLLKDGLLQTQLFLDLPIHLSIKALEPEHNARNHV
jgi:hypothetical protein